MSKKLIDMNPRWVGAGGEGISDSDGNPVPERHGIGISFDCPCGGNDRVFCHFQNPLDGGPCSEPHGHAWYRHGDTFENLTLSPSIQRADPDGCRWHGYVRNGLIVNA